MPLYEYQCTQCGKKTEVLQRFADAPLAACPACGGAVKKLISSPAFQFKGSGWYVTDYARKGGAGSTGETAGGADDGGSVSKPEAKSGSQSDSRSETSDSRSERSESRSERSESRSERSDKSDSRSEAKPDSKSAAKTESKSDSKSDSKSGAKGDSKPAAAGTGGGGS